MVDVFISYAPDERALAEPIFRALAEPELDVFFDIEVGVDAGAEFPDVINSAVRKAKAVLGLWSDLALSRRWVTIECGIGLDDEKLVAAAVAPITAPVPANFYDVSREDLTSFTLGAPHEGWARVLGALAGKLEAWAAKHEASEEAAATRAKAEALRRAAAEMRSKLGPLGGERPATSRAEQPAGTVFRDPLTGGGEGPEMCVIPAGRFLMGSPASEPERSSVEGPQQEIRFAKSFALGRCAVTFEEYDAYCAATGAEKPDDEGWGRGRRPVIHVSWEDAQGYCAWLSAQSGAAYRLPSEAEWEYACRAGTITPFWWGSSITTDQANYDGNYAYGGGAKGAYRERTEPVDAFAPNPWGLSQMHGNVWEWCEDCWNDSLSGQPDDGAARSDGDFALNVLRGGSWFDLPRGSRSAFRDGEPRSLRHGSVGFRVARTLVA